MMLSVWVLPLCNLSMLSRYPVHLHPMISLPLSRRTGALIGRSKNSPNSFKQFSWVTPPKEAHHDFLDREKYKIAIE